MHEEPLTSVRGETSEHTFGAVGIVGLGMIGGGLALDLLAAGQEVYGMDVDAETQELASKAGVKIVNSLAELGHCDAIILGTPMPAMPSVLQAISVELGTWTGLLSDTGGVKSLMQQWAEKYVPTLRFIGAHPMGGSSLGGFANASTGLFRGHMVALCPVQEPHFDAEGYALLQTLWSMAGATPTRMSADLHDKVAAYTSHRCYVSAVAQLNALPSLDEDSEEEPGGAYARLLGRGFADATRHARFDPAVMASVTTYNPYVAESLRSLASELLKIVHSIEQQSADWSEGALSAQHKRAQLMQAVNEQTGRDHDRITDPIAGSTR